MFASPFFGTLPLSRFPRLNYQTRQLGFDDLFEEVENAMASDPFFDMNHFVHQALPIAGAPALSLSNEGSSAMQVDKSKALQGKESGAPQLQQNGQQQQLQPAGSRDQAVTRFTPTTNNWLAAYARGPALDVVERDKEFVISVDVPGVDKADLKLQLTQDLRGRKLLTISGERKEEKDDEDKDKGYRSSQRLYGHFSRSVRLPENCKYDAVAAKHDNGVLKICVPKEDRARPPEASDIKID